MKKIIFLLAFASILYFVGCSNEDKTEAENSTAETTGNSETIELIPVRDGETVLDLSYSIPKSTVTIFPFNFYTSKSCEIPVTDFSDVAEVYYNATNVEDDEIEEIFGKKQNLSRASVYIRNFENLYIAGDIVKRGKYSNQDTSESFITMKKDSKGTFYYSFIYSNDMKYWGNGNGNVAFKFLSKSEWSDSTIEWGSASVLFTGKNSYFISKNGSKQKYNKHNLLTGLVEGNEYKIVVIGISDNYIMFRVEGKLSNVPTLLRGPFLRGIPTIDENGDWKYKKFEQNDDGTYYYDFTYSAKMEEKLTVKDYSIVFSILPSNSYALGAYCGIKDDANGELSKTVSSVADSAKTTYYPDSNHNIIFKNLTDCHKYRINLSKPFGATIEDTVYTITFSDLGKDETAEPFERREFYGLSGWQCLGGFNSWSRVWLDEKGNVAGKNTASILKEVSDEQGKYWEYSFKPLMETEEFKIMYGEWNWGYNYGNAKLAVNGKRKYEMMKSGGNATISGLDVSKFYKLKFTCTDTATLCNPGKVYVELFEDN